MTLTCYADYDPEDDAHIDPHTDSSDDDDEAPKSQGREHYEKVGKSKLRQPEQPKLSKKYGGVAVSRADLNSDDEDPLAPVDDDEEDDDPFAAAASDSEPDNSDLPRGQ